MRGCEREEDVAAGRRDALGVGTEVREAGACADPRRPLHVHIHAPEVLALGLLERLVGERTSPSTSLAREVAVLRFYWLPVVKLGLLSLMGTGSRKNPASARARPHATRCL